MSTKATLEQIEQATKQVGISDELRRDLIAMLADMLTPVEEEKTPPVKKQWVIMVSDPAGRIPADFETVGWVLQIEENESVASTERRLVDAAHHFNTTKRGRVMPVQTIGEACEVVKAGMFREAGVWVKTKVPVFVLRTRNEIPDTPSVLGGERGDYGRNDTANVITRDGRKITASQMTEEIGER